MGQNLDLWELLKGMESPWWLGKPWIGDLLKVCGRFGLAICQSPEWFRQFARVGLTTVNVCSKQQIVNLGVTLSGAEAGLLLRMN